MLLPALPGLLLAGCLNNGVKRQEAGNPDDPAIYQIRADDAEIRAAIMVAQYRFREFREAYEAGSPRDSAFMLKVPLSDSDFTEHLWIKVVGRQQDYYLGVLPGKPELVSGIAADDTVAVTPAELTDWSYMHDGRPVGDFSTRVIRRRMKPEERAAFDRETDGQYTE